MSSPRAEASVQSFQRSTDLDIEPDAEYHQEYGLACRLYRVGHSLGGLPDEDWLRQALLTAEIRHD